MIFLPLGSFYAAMKASLEKKREGNEKTVLTAVYGRCCIRIQSFSGSICFRQYPFPFGFGFLCRWKHALPGAHDTAPAPIPQGLYLFNRPYALVSCQSIRPACSRQLERVLPGCMIALAPALFSAYLSSAMEGTKMIRPPQLR